MAKKGWATVRIEAHPRGPKKSVPPMVQGGPLRTLHPRTPPFAPSLGAVGGAGAGAVGLLRGAREQRCGAIGGRGTARGGAPPFPSSGEPGRGWRKGCRPAGCTPPPASLRSTLGHRWHIFLGPRGWTSIRAGFPKKICIFAHQPKGGVDFYLDRFLGGPGVDLCSGMEQTRRVDLY